jgi:prepilin-type N-terminal cleavage/methylation domain-containing protein
MKFPCSHLHRGFTLIELSIAMMLGLATGSMLMALFNQQLAFLKLYKSQNFLTDEAPIISMNVSRLIGKADRFGLYDTVGDAFSEKKSRMGDSSLTPLPRVVALVFRQVDGTNRKTIMSFENRGGRNGLYYYVVPTSGVLGDPQWAISKAPANVSFGIENGILRMTLTGPKREQITYSGTMQQ